jgi:hypothetical protein
LDEAVEQACSAPTSDPRRPVDSNERHVFLGIEAGHFA